MISPNVFPAKYSTLARQTIAETESTTYQLICPNGFATLLSKLIYEGPGEEKGTLKVKLVTGYDDYSGTSGGPIVGLKKGLLQDYFLIALQSFQILAPTTEQKPTHLVATAVPLVLAMIDNQIKEMEESTKEPQ